MTKNLSVYLNETRVGVLTQLLDGRTFLAFDEHYKSDTERPTLSLSYKPILSEGLLGSPSAEMNLPPFFSNLLPEGRLRQYLANKWRFKETQEFKLLTALREDLPGAVILNLEGSEDNRGLESDSTSTPALKEGLLRFSLAGVQMKFSGNQIGDKLAIPVSGVGGHWIVKLPSPTYPNVVELEYSMLTLAKAVGITLPDFRLMATGSIENLPSDLPDALTGDSLISKRFDRTDSGSRIHMEDFAQVFAITDKYDERFNYQTIANVIWQEIGLDAALEFVRRLVFVVLTGNADMHLKNWSLIYPDSKQARLSPAYDLVSTIVYPDISRKLPHKIAGEDQFDKIDLQTFRTFAKIAELPERAVLGCISETVDLLKEHWLRLKNDLPIPSSFVRIIDEHISKVPLATEQVTSIPVSTPVPLNMTWPGSFVNWQVQLDPNVPNGKIVYKNQAEEKVELDAPRRMVQTLIHRQIHKLLTSRRDFVNQLIVGFVGIELYDEWRDETIVRILKRRVNSELDQKKLQEPELTLDAVFFPNDWRKLQEHFKNKDQFFDLDFVLADGELWTVEATIAAMGKSFDVQTGMRSLELKLYIRNPRRLYVVPPKDRLTFSSGRFSIEESNLTKSRKKKKKEEL